MTDDWARAFFLMYFVLFWLAVLALISPKLVHNDITSRWDAVKLWGCAVILLGIGVLIGGTEPLMPFKFPLGKFPGFSLDVTPFFEFQGILMMSGSMAIALWLPVLATWPTVARRIPILFAIGTHPWRSILAGGVLAILGVRFLPVDSLWTLATPFVWVCCLTVAVTVVFLKTVGGILNKLNKPPD